MHLDTKAQLYEFKTPRSFPSTKHKSHTKCNFRHATTSCLAKLFLTNKSFCVGTQISNPTFWYKIKTSDFPTGRWRHTGFKVSSGLNCLSLMKWKIGWRGRGETNCCEDGKREGPLFGKFYEDYWKLSWMNKLRFLMDFIWIRLHEGEQTYVHYTNSQDILLSRVLGFSVY